jgi:hypothetical protein
MRGGPNVISNKIAPATFYKVRHQIRVMQVAAIMGSKSSPGRADVKGSTYVAPAQAGAQSFRKIGPRLRGDDNN